MHDYVECRKEKHTHDLFKWSRKGGKAIVGPNVPVEELTSTKVKKWEHKYDLVLKFYKILHTAIFCYK